MLQVNRSRREADDALAQLEQCRRELASARQDAESSKVFVNSAIQYCFYFVALLSVRSLRNKQVVQ